MSFEFFFYHVSDLMKTFIYITIKLLSILTYFQWFFLSKHSVMVSVAVDSEPIPEGKKAKIHLGWDTSSLQGLTNTHTFTPRDTSSKPIYLQACFWIVVRKGRAQRKLSVNTERICRNLSWGSYLGLWKCKGTLLPAVCDLMHIIEDGSNDYKCVKNVSQG